MLFTELIIGFYAMDQEKKIKTAFFNPDGFKPVAVGLRVREIRTQKGLSIKALAEMSGLAVNTLSLIENQKSSPSVSTLEQLAKTLQVPLNTFFKPFDATPDLIFTQSTKRQAIDLEGIRVEDCGINFSGKPLQPLFVSLSSGKGSGPDNIQHYGYEFVFCISGEIEYNVGEDKFDLSAGGSLFFDAQRPHRWNNHQSQHATYLLLIVPGESEKGLGEVHFSLQESEEDLG